MSKDNTLFFLPLHDLENIDLRPKKLGGQPCLKGHRISLAQFLAELSERKSIDDFAEAYDLDPSFCRSILEQLSTAITKEHNIIRELNKHASE